VRIYVCVHMFVCECAREMEFCTALFCMVLSGSKLF